MKVKKQRIGSRDSNPGKVEAFLNTYTNQYTKQNYHDGLYDFFCVVFGEPSVSNGTEKLEWMKLKGEEYFTQERGYEKDVEQLVIELNGRPPKTIKLKVTAAKMFLLENNVELPQKFWRKIRRRIKGSRALTLDKVPSNKELNQLMMHLPVHGKALFLMLESSGMRIGEALQLKVEDVNHHKNPAWIEIRGEYTKSGNPRVAFASSEARDALVEWLKVREQYIETAVGRSHLYEKLDANKENRLFPFGDTTVYMFWGKALKNAGMADRDPSTNRFKLHVHTLRKFFRTRLGSVIPVDIVEALMGHEGYLTKVYRRYSHEELAKFYLEGEKALAVFGRVVGDEELEKDINTLFRENRDLRNRIQDTEEENKEWKNRMKLLTEKLDLLEKGLLELKQKSNS